MHATLSRRDESITPVDLRGSRNLPEKKGIKRREAERENMESSSSALRHVGGLPPPAELDEAGVMCVRDIEAPCNCRRLRQSAAWSSLKSASVR
jgi:hypothetical protein